MNIEKITRMLILTATVSLVSIPETGLSQYTVGQSLSQSSRDREVSFCANEAGTESIADLLLPAPGEPTRVLWLNFFASY